MDECVDAALANRNSNGVPGRVEILPKLKYALNNMLVSSMISAMGPCTEVRHACLKDALQA